MKPPLPATCGFCPVQTWSLAIMGLCSVSTAAWAQKIPAAVGSHALALDAGLPPGLGLLAGTVFSAALASLVTAGVIAAMLARRGLLEPLAAAVAGINASGERLARVAVRAGSTQDEVDAATSAARAAARDTEAVVTALTNDYARLRSLLNAAETGQDKVSALADQCGRLTEVMPGVLASAVETMQARGLTGLEAMTLHVQQSACGIDRATASLQASLIAMRESLARQDTTQESLGAAVPVVVTDVESLVTRLQLGAGRVDASAAALHAEIAGMQEAARHHAVLQSRSAGLALLCERLMRDLPAQAGDAVCAFEARAHTLLDRMDAQCAGQTARIENASQSAAADVQKAVTGLNEAGAAHAAALEAACALLNGSVQSAAAWPEAAKAMLHTIEAAQGAATQAAEQANASMSRQYASLDECFRQAAFLMDGVPGLNQSLRDAAAAWPAALAGLADVTAGGERALASATRRLAELQDRADAALRTGTDPASSSQDNTGAVTAAAAAALAVQVASLREVQCCLEAAQTDHMARLETVIDRPVDALTDVCASAKATFSSLNDMCGRLEAGLAALVACPEQTRAALHTALSPLAGQQDAGAADAAATRLALQSDRLAELVYAGDESACRLAIATDAAVAVLDARPHQTGLTPVHTKADAALADLTARIEQIAGAATRLAAQAEIQTDSAGRMTHAALVLAQAANAVSESSPAAPRGIGVTVHAVQDHALALHTAASAAARDAVLGRDQMLPADFGAAAPVLLASIDLSIRQLQGAATALALASDAWSHAA